METLQVRRRQHHKHQDPFNPGFAFIETVIPAAFFQRYRADLEDYHVKEKGTRDYRLLVRERQESIFLVADLFDISVL